MFSKKEQYKVLQQIRFKEGETKRIDCPFCGGKYTLTVTVNDARGQESRIFHRSY